jgi:hypothetical protein
MLRRYYQYQQYRCYLKSTDVTIAEMETAGKRSVQVNVKMSSEDFSDSRNLLPKIFLRENSPNATGENHQYHGFPGRKCWRWAFLRRRPSRPARASADRTRGIGWIGRDHNLLTAPAAPFHLRKEHEHGAPLGVNVSARIKPSQEVGHAPTMFLSRDRSQTLNGLLLLRRQ